MTPLPGFGFSDKAGLYVRPLGRSRSGRPNFLPTSSSFGVNLRTMAMAMAIIESLLPR